MTKAESVASRTPRHYPAAFINSIAEEGTKDEAVGWLQRIWNERCTLELEASELRSCIKDLRERLAKAERDARRYRWLRTHFRFANDSVREIWFDPNIDLAGAYGAHEPDELDASIDAAIENEKGGGHE